MLAIKGVSSTIPRSTWSILRIVIIFILGVGVTLIALMWTLSDDSNALLNYTASNMLSPTICLIWFALVVITHINTGGVKLSWGMFRSKKLSARRKSKGKVKETNGEVKETNDEMKETNDEAKGTNAEVRETNDKS